MVLLAGYESIAPPERPGAGETTAYRHMNAILATRFPELSTIGTLFFVWFFVCVFFFFFWGGGGGGG